MLALVRSLVARARQSSVFWQIVRFGLVGGFVTALGAAVYLAAAYAGVPPLLANFLNYLAAMAAGFVLHSKVSFRGHGSRDNPAKRSARFVVVSLISLALNSLFVWGMTGPLGWPLWSPVLTMIFVVPIVTFTLQRRWVFG
jgi:putative flippase GtrA